ncbi:MAG: GspH/FimT family pseudopilin [Natronospirillum sp.]|uniref:GspH/FimT family pseudopilin n=1 Tax=Natronospirillum sp. TaxID=2812955 RepID=UPI0025ECEE3F|nr:GspH/FimT family pseudopilin [Natronospirillum sp.]MCH8550510.1 GspH/FimT family pseudopilin [Natronospirillum sp.]
MRTIQAASRQQGFKLLELMLVVSLLALTASFGGQQMRDLVSGSQVRSSVHTVHIAFRLARQTAVEERTTITLCVLDEDGACGPQWNNGPLVVFRDPNHNRQVHTADQVVRQFELPDNVRLSSHPSHMPWHQYNLMGAPRRATGGHVRLCAPGESGERARIIIAQAGRTRLERYDEPGEACVE